MVKMDKRYDHVNHEKRIYAMWEKSGVFTPSLSKNKKPYTIIMPPPNANDNLHVGHARFITIEDILVRYHRMKGHPTLWLPGADHAGIETQYVFEKRLKKEGKSRFDYDRETLYKMIWDYSIEMKVNMENQLRSLGASCDWSRNTFTLDPNIVKVVYKTFKKLYDDGLVYRGERIVNYCPRCGTAFSQLEVNHVERDDDFYFIDYGLVTIATTRPETIFADVAVAVNSKDNRYKNIIGKKATLPIVNRKLPIIDSSLVDPDFGTGALKITPAHDAIDFEIGQNNNLPIISVIDKSGKMINTPKKYIGLKAEIARNEVVKDLQKLGKIKKIEKIHHTVGICYRDKGLIEPMISKQWFLKVQSLAKSSLTAIKKKEVNFVAKRYEKIAKHWLKNLKDWNISRQIVWGMRIPAYRCDKCLEWTITDGTIPKKCRACKHDKLTQDKDTFDTWFSSGQWPYATLKTTKKGDFNYFYPTTVMETGYDILPFWVLRMIMLGLYTTNKVPFKDVLIHGLVRDKNGEKISKSKGNVIDPLVMAEKYGADALRMGIIWGALVENDVALSENNIRGQRNFTNKIWNIARFLNILLKQEGFNKYSDLLPYSNNLKPKLSNKDKNFIKDFEITIKKVTMSLDKYRINEAAEDIYSFMWNRLASVYIEDVKKRKDKEHGLIILRHVLINSLKLLHPFMPFVTEAIWQNIERRYEKPLISSSWPKL